MQEENKEQNQEKGIGKDEDVRYHLVVETWLDPETVDLLEKGALEVVSFIVPSVFAYFLKARYGNWDLFALVEEDVREEYSQFEQDVVMVGCGEMTDSIL